MIQYHDSPGLNVQHTSEVKMTLRWCWFPLHSVPDEGHMLNTRLSYQLFDKYARTCIFSNFTSSSDAFVCTFSWFEDVTDMLLTLNT